MWQTQRRGQGHPGGAKGDPDEDAALQDEGEPKLPTKEPEPTVPSLDITGETGDTIEFPETGADDAAEEVDDAVVAGSNETQDASTARTPRPPMKSGSCCMA